MILSRKDYKAYGRRAVGTSVRGPGSQEGVHESLNGPIVLTINVLYLFLMFIILLLLLFSTIFSLFRKIIK